MSPRSRRLLVPALTSLACFAGACAASSSDSASSEDALRLHAAPDPYNDWTKDLDLSQVAVGEENFLPDEDARFTSIAERFTKLQDALAHMNGGTPEHGLHVKSHACVRGELAIKVPSSLSTVRAGFFATDATYPTWVRFSNGAAIRQADKKADGRGLAIKVMNVAGPKLLANGEEPRTQDFLMTSAPTAPAASATQFMNFSEAMGNAALTAEGSKLGMLEALLDTGLFLARPENARTREFVLGTIVPRALAHGSLAGEQFWSQGAIAMGIEPGDPLRAKAKQAFRMTAIAGMLDGDRCVPVARLPKVTDADYLGNDMRPRLKSGKACFDLQIQLQRDPAKQILEDASVDWSLDEAPFVSVGRLTIPPVDVDGDEHAKAAQAFCNTLSFQQWHGLREHRPLGNIMRVRRFAYAATAQHRQAAPEPRGDETF